MIRGNQPTVIGMIPARLAATRLPNKPLLDLCGKTMIRRVWEQACKAELLEDVLVVTPDEAILEAVHAFGGKAMMTSPAHRSGTDRLAEAAARLSCDIVANIQGDEPLIAPASIDALVRPLLEDPDLRMASLCCVCPEAELQHAATVKVVCDRDGNALYFSRATIPYRRNPEGEARVMQHIGLYAYRREFLLEYARWSPTPLEMTESLEQLRVLEHGHRIRMVQVEEAPLSVDTPDDLARMRAILSGNSATESPV